VLLTREGIEALIPHAGPMCLLDGVAQWDESRIRCVTRTHLDARNPLRLDGRLPVLCGIEYAAQAMAVHGGLARSAGAKPRAGYLASVRDVACARDRLDDLEGDLMIEAWRLMGDGERVVYGFSLTAGGKEVMRGRAAAVLEVSSLESQVPSPGLKPQAPKP
jgi:predicted hotdog family 3-hydroxylacyl-ACP dehydratase